MTTRAVTSAVLFHGNLADPNQATHFLKNVAVAGGLLVAARRSRWAA